LREAHYRIEPHYLPSLEFFCAVHHASVIEWEVSGHFVKQTYRNRCQILGANGPLTLTVPLDARRNKTLYRDIRIDYRQNWQNIHWRSLESAYRNAPYFEFYADELRRELFTGHQFLADLNIALLTLCLRWIKRAPMAARTESFDIHTPGGIIDLRDRISARTGFETRPFYQPQPYYQVFGKAFAANLSIVDLLCCEGPGASLLLEQCTVQQG